MPKREGRRIPLQAGSPAENMAIDQALLESVQPHSRPVLRMYTWSEPTLSLGYFQKIGDRRNHAESTDLRCIRRSTGGGAIVHHHELTYSMVMPMTGISPRPNQIGPQFDLYRQTHRAIVQLLSEFGVRAAPFRMTPRTSATRQVPKTGDSTEPFLCFQRRTEEDLIVCGYKVLGSAQRKTRHAILQHGSLLLRTSPWAPQLPGIWELTSNQVPMRELAERLGVIMGNEFSIDWLSDEISPAEHQRASAIQAERFAAQRWLSRR